MNFYLQKGTDEEHPCLTATAWRGPFAFDTTEEEKYSMDFSFSDEGIRQADEWLTEQQKLLFGDEKTGK